MPVAIACPKCQSRYQLPESALGKAVKCKKCGATFRTAAQKKAAPSQAKRARQPQPGQKTTAQPGGSQASPQELAKLGIDGPLQRQGDIFAGTAPQPGNQLGNFALEDPGFADVRVAQAEVREEAETSDGMSSIVNNPYAMSVNERIKKKTAKKIRVEEEKKKLSKQPWFLILAIFIPWFMVAGMLGILLPSVSYGLALIGLILLGLLNFVLAFWYLKAANDDSEGAEMILLFFIPFYAFFFLYNHWQAMKDVMYASFALTLCLIFGFVALIVPPIISGLIWG